jgi:N-acyl-D-aspartate/D-glutamate deacylase
VAHFDQYLIGEVYSPDNEAVRGRMVGDIAEERGVDPFTCLVDIVANDDLRTVLWPQPATNGPDDWRARAELWQHRDVMLGGSDAGAHLDRMLGSPYPTRFLGDTLRGRQLVPLERAVQLITDVPAGLFGLRDRGRLASGNFADIVVFDPERIDAGSPETVFDLPGESKRLLASSIGVEHVFVNGIETIAAGAATGNISGTVLRSGQDTYTVDTASS